MKDSAVISIKAVSKVFKKDLFDQEHRVLDNVSFDLESNKIIGFLGANGAGKTTLLKIIMGFIPPTEGSCDFLFKEQGPSRLQHIGYLPERPYFHPHLTGRMFLEYMSSLCGMKSIDDRVETLDGYLRISHAFNKSLKSYSKGMLQRLGIMAALLHDPKVIILDEPLAGLDPKGRKEIKDLLCHLRDNGKTIFFSSHIVSDVESICEKVIFLDSGKIVFEGKIDDILQTEMSLDFIIDYRMQGTVESQRVKKKNKEDILKEILDRGGEIIRVDHDRPSLEDILYNVRT